MIIRRAHTDDVMKSFGALCFAIPATVRPEEGLPDIIFKSVAQNGFNDVRIINRILGTDELAGWSHSALTMRNIDVEGVAHVLGLDVSAVEARCYGRVPGLINFFGANITYSNLSGSRRVSPQHFEEHEYQKAIWGLRCLSFDPGTRELLIDRCQRCEKVLSFYRTAGVAFCSNCGADLRKFSQPRVEIDDEAALDFFLSLIAPSAARFDLASLDNDLHALLPGDIFTLIVESAKLLDFQKEGKPPSASRNCGHSYPVSPESLLTASRAVMDWPEGFLKVANTIRQAKYRENSQQRHPLIRSIPSYYPKLISFLGRKLHIFTESDLRTGYRFRNSSTVARNDRFRLPSSVRMHAEITGLPRCEIMSLYQAGSIVCPDQSLKGILGGRESASAIEVGHFVTSFRKGSSGLPLFEVVQSVRPSRQPWEAIFSALISGDITATFNPRRGHNRRLIRCLFTQDIKSVHSLCQSQLSTLDPETEITRNELFFYLPMGMSAILSLRRNGLLPRGKVKLRDVWGLQDRYITMFELYCRLMVSGIRTAPSVLAQALDEAALLKIVSGSSLYCREEGAAFLNSYILRAERRGQNQENCRDQAITGT